MGTRKRWFATPGPRRRLAGTPCGRLDAFDVGIAGRAAILSATSDRDASLRRQALRQIGTRRSRAATDVVRRRLDDPDASVRFQASTALGRIGNPAAVAALIDALDEGDQVARYAAITALNRVGCADNSAWRTIVRALAHAQPTIREGARLALRESYVDELVQALTEFAGDADTPPESKVEAVRLLATVYGGGRLEGRMVGLSSRAQRSTGKD